jgi:pectinesterase
MCTEIRVSFTKSIMLIKGYTMNRILKTILFFSVAGTMVQGKSVTIAVSNPSIYYRLSETITINLHGLYQSNPEFQGKDISIVESSTKLVHQMIDENFDGVYDILIFQASFKPKEKKKFILSISTTTKIETPTVVDGRFFLPRQDFAWENDRIAFRVYGSPLAGDVMNGTDVWNKRVRYPIIKKWYNGEEQNPKISYHQDHGEGADYFSVGRSLGCGSAGIFWKGNLVQSGLFSFYRVITNGPIRVSFELYFPKLKLDTIEVLEIKRVTLDAGSNLNKIEEQFISNLPIDDLTIAAGLVKRKNTSALQNTKQGWLTLWGLTTADSAVGYLGTAVVMGEGQPSVSSEDSIHCFLTTSLKKKSSIIYYAGAGWTLSGDFASGKEWSAYIERFSENLKQPLVVNMIKK